MASQNPSTPQTCPTCHQPLTPGVKYCESCGKPVGSPPAGPGPVVQTPAPERVQEPEKTPAEPETRQPASSPVNETLQKEASPTGSSNKTIIIAGVVGIIIIAALGYFIVLPMISGTGNGGISLPGTSSAPAAAPAAASGSQNAVAVSFEPKPTDRVPTNLQVTFQAERNNISGLVTVTFSGGPGMNGISQAEVTLTKSDGTVEKKTFKPKQTGDSITLPGTLKTDRLEVIAHYYSGESFRILDQLFEYKKKNF